MMTQKDGSLAGRVERLEKENRLWKLGTVSAVALLAAAVLMGATEQGSGAREARVKRLVIVNEAGTEVASLGADTYGKAKLSFLDADGRLQMEMGTQLGPHLWFMGDDAQACVQLGVWRWEDADKEVPSLRFCDSKGAERIKLGYDLEYKPALEICCKNGREVVLGGDE